MILAPLPLLAALSILATLSGTQLYLSHELRKQPESNETPVETLNYITQLELEIEQLTQDIENLRSLVQSGGDIQIDPALISFVEKDLKLSFKFPPPAIQVAHDTIQESVGQRWLATFGEQGMAMRSYAFEKLGLIPVNQNFIQQLITAESNGAVGVFDLSSGEILLDSSFDPENVHHQATLVRLLAIALLEQHAPLPKVISDDAFHAREAIHRGRALMLQQLFYNINAQQIGFVAPPNNAEIRETFESLSRYCRDITHFSNTFGKTYVELLNRDQPEAITELLLNPDISTRSILLAKPGTTPSQPAAQLAVEQSADTQLATSLGAFTIRSFAAQWLAAEELPQLITDYTSDDLTISLTPDNMALTSWKTQWTSERAAEKFALLAKEITSALTYPPEVLVQKNQVELRFSDLPNK